MRIVKNAFYRLYARRLRSQLARGPIPRHVAMVMDGNRRWARQQGFDNPSVGHRYGAEHIDDVLDWRAEAGISHVTVFVASTDNLRKRASGEVQFLMDVIERIVAERMSHRTGVWQLHLAGRLDALPDSTRHALKLAQDATSEHDATFHLTVAVGYDGREEVVDALRSLLDHEARRGTALEDLAQRLTADDIAAHLYTSGQPDPDLIIRTSGEQRMSGFLLWQAAYSELYFCDVYWPGFRHVDFLRALRSYAARHRRYGA
ncbi:short-chain Z-isoprenyl diphosphate synthase [Allocatelliglobosispora scoriae]|uniref:Isoprenyl transferase n=1 Tax=Allocatelliglobosispora scoriae TaxID=643052 RepID=A0A841C5F1_9ACTN|nr:polyprenyl diphosphate synthase [Allocatelliglobosispora scoriae]MBB5874363.1 short-chain Z-isoprenyl diphosphate synthase [Allocatelliglobosispora scoriae]